ncbi:differentially expressed in FDCP 8 homolog isoform X2 [Episyrphus balteatus]|uniref:differentially expressed in FDCP 8 homolog isoform X2 n=1 Tax=Episyrphus balteatus TaxID=286459 RepID=UPI0024856BB7|nr:differentially expressed in FDCP 8 homolog isoform X2 [Episyrphus balteatus]
MNSFRESIASIPSAVTNFLSESTSSYMNLSTTPSSSHSEESSSDKPLTIPASLIKEQWRLVLNSDDATISNLEEAINTCKELVLNTDEVSIERKWLVRHLVELRYELEQLKDSEDNPNESGPSTKTVIGHHFNVRHVGRSLQNARSYCDHCTGIIWSVVQASYICNDCKYTVHSKCINDIVRVCAHVVVSERKNPIADICPEIGLAAQGYKCAECQAALTFKNAWVEPRICDYSGLYYCPSCHWSDVSIIPARIVHNWDFLPRKVCRASLQEINLFLDKPLVKLEEANPKLFVFLQKLSSIKKLRENLCYMRKYLLECRIAIDAKLLDNQIGSRRHLVQSSEFYSFKDLEQVESSALYEFLSKIYSTFDKHIRICALCTAKAYICEICSNDEVIYPFDDGCIICDKCKSIYHRVCMTRKNMICPKCTRLKERQLLQTQEIEDAENGN